MTTKVTDGWVILATDRRDLGLPMKVVSTRNYGIAEATPDAAAARRFASEAVADAWIRAGSNDGLDALKRRYALTPARIP